MPHYRLPKENNQYYLPKYTFRTVVNFCFQYHELKEQLASIDGWHSGNNDGMPHGTGTSDPVANDAIRRAEIQKKIDIIEESVMECTDEVTYPFFLQAITEENHGYEFINRNVQVPMNGKEFSKVRRKIYYTIAHKI